MLFELLFEAFEEREGVRRAAGEACDYLILIELAHLARIAFHDGVALRDLTVAAYHDLIPATNGDDRRSSVLFQVFLPQ
jgi:hypothetical protein